MLFFRYLLFIEPALDGLQNFHQTGFITVAAKSLSPLFTQKIGLQSH
jgi:hypothetical protein